MKVTQIVFAISILMGSNVMGQRPINPELFDSTDLLPITLIFDINETIKDTEEREDHPATLSYQNEAGDMINIELQISVRGKTRANPLVCRFPPLELNFKKKGNQGNLFEGQDKIKLVTHCNSPTGYDQYVINEFLVYKAYNILTNRSHKVRLLKVTYQDSEGKGSSFERMGFIVEHIDQLAQRHGMVEIERKLPNQDICEHDALDLFTLFQFMIGNTDWSIVQQHNVKLIGKENTTQPIPIPYDFDYSGIIATSYAEAPENLPIEDVKQRIFRGFCRKSGDYEQIFEIFIYKKQDIYDTFLKDDLLNDRNKKRIERYLNGFYAVIEDPRKAAREINGACRLDHEHLK